MKQRRDITLGEMQDECLKHKMCEGCPHTEWCGANSADGWDLTDPPRFTDAQMALLEALYENGVMQLRSDCAITSLFGSDHEYIGNLINSQIGIELSDGETLDLAELLGKDAT